MIIVKGRKHTCPLCFLPCGKLVGYRHGSIIVMNAGNTEKCIHIFDSFQERFWGRSKFLTRLFRLGVRAAVAISDEKIILSLGNVLHELNLSTNNLSDGFFCGEGIRPLMMSTVKGIKGIDDGIYFGGYLGNGGKKPVNIYQRMGEDEWKIVYTFPQGAINHVHNIVPDPYRHCLWIFTGDFGEAAAIWKVTDHFKEVKRVAYNDQRFRACVVFALPEGLLYATDAPFEDDFIYLMDPESLQSKILSPIHGSCIYGCQWKDKFVFSSTVEGDGRSMKKMQFYLTRKRGKGIKDNYVHMYCGNIKQGFQEIYKEKKDCMPFYTFQFGVFRFPYGINYSDFLYFQPVATSSNDMNMLIIKDICK